MKNIKFYKSILTLFFTLVLVLALSIIVGAEGDLPDSYDLSIISNPYSKYLPNIGTQTYNSCVSFASTYYQFTYEANKFNTIKTTVDNTYSPFWTFSLTNGGQNKGTGLATACDAIKTFGAIKQSDYEAEKIKHDISDLNFYWESSDDLKVIALKTRIKNYYSHNVSVKSSEPTITFNTGTESDHVFDDVKKTLTQGKAITFEMTYNPSPGVFQSPTYGEIIYRITEDESRGHAVTIVGYDDNVGFDVNNNNVIEPCEKGAFKVANSWGKERHNDGYLWILYDAFNKISANNINDWESQLSGTRKSIFMSPNKGSFYYIEVENSDMNFIGKISLSTTRRYQVQFNFAKTTKSNPSSSDWIEVLPNWSMGNEYFLNIGYNGNMFFDLGTLGIPSDRYYQYYNWFVTWNRVEPGAGSGVNYVSFKILDNLGHVIKDFGNLTENITYKESLNIDFGDLDYDGKRTNNDLDILRYHLANIPYELSNIITSELSNIQIFIADCNLDNLVNQKDVLALRQMINS